MAVKCKGTPVFTMVFGNVQQKYTQNAVLSAIFLFCLFKGEGHQIWKIILQIRTQHI